MPTLEEKFSGFFAISQDPGPKAITYVIARRPFDSWLPIANSGEKIKTFIKPDNPGIIVQEASGSWPPGMIDLIKTLEYADNPDVALGLVNTTDLSGEDFGDGWFIEKWELVATDKHGQETTFIQENSLICDKITWKNERLGRFITQHGWEHYNNNGGGM